MMLVVAYNVYMYMYMYIQCILHVFCCSHLLKDKITDEKEKIDEIARLQNEVNA